MKELQIHDIKNFETIEVDFFWYYVDFFMIALLLLGVFYFLRYKKKKRTILREYLRGLFDKNLSDKEIAYAFTKYAKRILVDEAKTQYADIVTQLENHKYKKQIPSIDDKLKSQMISYIKRFV